MHPELLVRKRMMLLTVVLLTLFALAVARVGQLTTIRSAELTRRGVSQWTKAGTVTARRGKMVDRNGNVLVVSATSYIVCADPRAVSDEALFLDTLVPVLSLDRETALKKLRDKTKGQVILKRQVPRETVDQLRTLKQEAAEETGLKALTFEEDASRWYPYGEMLSQVLGLTNVDSAGQSGLEKQYDAALAGVAGKYLHQVDARNRTLADSESYYTASSPGATLKLTIDATIQEICEKAMRECLEVNQAESVLCLVSDVRTGAILAMCMRPDYDPNDPPRSNVEELTSLMRITAISDVYEPGSTFKILTQIHVGTAELLLSDSELLAEAMRRDRVSVQLIRWEGMCHVFQMFGFPESRESLKAIGAFLRYKLHISPETEERSEKDGSV